MTGREKPKRKALHRGLDDIVNRDASLTSKLLGRVKPPEREPLDLTHAEDSSPEVTPAAGAMASGHGLRKASPRPAAETASVHHIEAARQQSATPERGIQEREVAARRGAVAGKAISTFEEFAERWGFILRSGAREGKLRICEVLFRNTYEKGENVFFTSYEKLARLTGLEKKQCAINIRQLESLGFVERLNIYNTATRQGTEFKLHLDQLPSEARQTPRRHHFNEELPAKS